MVVVKLEEYLEYVTFFISFGMILMMCLIRS
jgi:hypothetical protein